MKKATKITATAANKNKNNNKKKGDAPTSSAATTSKQKKEASGGGSKMQQQKKKPHLSNGVKKTKGAAATPAPKKSSLKIEDEKKTKKLRDQEQKKKSKTTSRKRRWEEGDDDDDDEQRRKQSSSSPSTKTTPTNSANPRERRRESPTTTSRVAVAAAPAAATAATTGGGGMKRVRSSWRLRPLIVDEKLRVFVEGQDEELLHYDGGEFWAWLKDCEAGVADPADGFPYPLIVQDSDLRTLLEIKEPAPVVEKGSSGGGMTKTATTNEANEKKKKKKKEKKEEVVGSGGTGVLEQTITVPTWMELHKGQRADIMLHSMKEQVPIVQRRIPGDSPAPDVSGRSAAAVAAAAAWSSAQAALASDPPFIRYVQPTPDDMDLAIEYDLDEDDEEWLNGYNADANTTSKARASKKLLREEHLEHLIDRMEKEYTAELQRHPEKWVLGGGGGGDISDPSAPEVSLPPIEEIFPMDKCLEKCMDIEGVDPHPTETAVKAVYKYWKEKHRKAGRPLIPRLWYEPPWDRKAAARRLALPAAGEDGGDGVFAGHESPLALAGIRKRRMDEYEVRARFESIRRDLEQARTLADQVRKREKLKRREAQLLKEEWATRMQGIADGQKVVMVKGKLKHRPPQVHVLKMLSRAGQHARAQNHQHQHHQHHHHQHHHLHLHHQVPTSTTANALSLGLGFDPFDFGGEVMPQGGGGENRAARLAARRDAREAAAAGLPHVPPRDRPPPLSLQRERNSNNRKSIVVRKVIKIRIDLPCMEEAGVVREEEEVTTA